MRVRFGLLSCSGFFRTPDGDGGDAGGGGAGGDADAPKYTQKELEQRIADSHKHWRKGLQKESKEKDTKIAGLETKLSELTAQIEELNQRKATGGTSTPVQDDELQGKIELLERKHAKALDELNRKVEDADRRRAAAEEKAKMTRRDTLLNQALAKAKCIDMTAGYRIFLPDVEFDEDEDTWVLRTPQGNTTSLDEGVASLLPEYLKPATADHGGSGSRTGSPTRRQKVSEFESEKKKLQTLRTQTTQDPNNVELMNRFMGQRNKVNRLEKELAGIK